MLTETEKILACLVSCEGWGSGWLRGIEEARREHKITWQELWAQPASSGKASRLTDEKIKAIGQFKERFTPDNYGEYLVEKNIRVLTLSSEEYPARLKYIPDYPLVLFARGDLSSLEKVAVGIVGTRLPTDYGVAVTEKIVAELAENEVTVTSGFMYGVDTVAQCTAEKMGGKSVGFLGYGFDCVYPQENKKYFAELLSAGHGFISEYPPWQHGSKLTFPARNRLVAGASLGVVVTEAAIKSGTMITARLAADYGREVLAVPGSIFSEYSEGTRFLLNLGATLVSSGEDVLRAISESTRRPLPSIFYEQISKNIKKSSQKVGSEKRVKKAPINSKMLTEITDKKAKNIYLQLAAAPATVETLSATSGYNLSEVLVILSQLEVMGLIENQGEMYLAVKN